MIKAHHNKGIKFSPFKREIEFSPQMNKSFRITKNKFFSNDTKSDISSMLTIDKKCLVSYGSHPILKENKTFLMECPSKKFNLTMSNFMKNNMKREKKSQISKNEVKIKRINEKKAFKGNIPSSKTERSNESQQEKKNPTSSCSKNRNTIDIVSKDLYSMGFQIETKVRKMHTHSPSWSKQENFIKLIQALRKTQKNDQSFQILTKEKDENTTYEITKSFVKNRKLQKLKQTIQEINSSRSRHSKKNTVIEKIEPWILDEKKLDFTIQDY